MATRSISTKMRKPPGKLCHYFGEPRVHDSIFKSLNKLVAMLWNKMFEMSSSIFYPANVGASLIHYGRKLPTEMETHGFGAVQ
eukprot:5187130-Pleurochrysis_carterae.AAC.1